MPFTPFRFPATTMLAVAALLSGVAVGSVHETLAATSPPGSQATPQAVGPGAGPATVLAAMTPAQRVGQLFMVGNPATGVLPSTVSAVQDYHVGSVILTGRSSAGVSAVRAVTGRLQSLATPTATGGVPLLVSADQEGGYVQALSGPGFSTMPTALTQGAWPTGSLTAAARTWGGQLAAAGVHLDLAPVLDTVPVDMVARTSRSGATDASTATTRARSRRKVRRCSQGCTTPAWPAR